MVTSVAVHFIKLDDYDEELDVTELYQSPIVEYSWQGYIDEGYRHFQLVDEEQGLYREAVFSAFLDVEGKPLSEINYERIFAIWTYTEQDYREDESHHYKWLEKFRQANQDYILFLVFELSRQWDHFSCA